MSYAIPRPATIAAPGAVALWPAFATIPDVSELSGLSRSAIYRAAGEGRIVMRKLGRSVLVDMGSVRGFLDALPAATIKRSAA